MTDDLGELLPSPKWQNVAGRIEGADECYISRDIAVAFVKAGNAVDAAARWPEVQTRLEEFRKTLPNALDCYLVMIIPRLNEEEYAALRPALDNTITCRKVVVPLDGRSVTDALRRDFPLVAPDDDLDAGSRRHTSGVGDPSDDDLQLLDKNGVERIADLLVQRLRKQAEGG